MQIEQWPLDRIKPFPDNPRKNDAAVESVAKSIIDFGFRQPVVVDRDGVIVVGHTRWKAAQKLGLATVPVHVASELTPEQARAYRVADNQTATIAEWDDGLLAAELKALSELGLDIKGLGFDDDELTRLFAPPVLEALVDPDDVPEPPEAATTRPGDLWILGEHRLLCGDSGSVADVDRLMDGHPAHMTTSDPPYNVRAEPRSNNAIMAGLSTHKRPHGVRGTDKHLRAKDRPLANDFVSDEQFRTLMNAWFGNIARVLIPGGGYYVWGGYSNVANYPPVLKAHGLYFSQAIIWHKQHPTITRKDFMADHEWCFYGWKEGAAHRFFGPNNIPDVWSVKKVNPASMVHLTEKPVELAKRAIEYSSQSGEVVLDLFGGSGSTLIAAQMAGRRARLMELDTLYADVIVNRWETFTGKKAERVAGAGITEKAPAKAGA